MRVSGAAGPAPSSSSSPEMSRAVRGRSDEEAFAEALLALCIDAAWEGMHEALNTCTHRWEGVTVQGCRSSIRTL